MPAIVPNLWFDTEALEAAEFYVSIFPNSQVGAVGYYGAEGLGDPGTVMTVEFTLDGHRMTAINGGPQFPFTEAISLAVECRDQAEVDYYWEALTRSGTPGQCGWLEDRYGVSWQVFPVRLVDLLTDPDEERRLRARRAMLPMQRIDLAVIEAAVAEG